MVYRHKGSHDFAVAHSCLPEFGSSPESSRLTPPSILKKRKGAEDCPSDTDKSGDKAVAATPKKKCSGEQNDGATAALSPLSKYMAYNMVPMCSPLTSLQSSGTKNAGNSPNDRQRESAIEGRYSVPSSPFREAMSPSRPQGPNPGHFYFVMTPLRTMDTSQSSMAQSVVNTTLWSPLGPTSPVGAMYGSPMGFLRSPVTRGGSAAGSTPSSGTKVDGAAYFLNPQTPGPQQPGTLSSPHESPSDAKVYEHGPVSCDSSPVEQRRGDSSSSRLKRPIPPVPRLRKNLRAAFDSSVDCETATKKGSNGLE